MAEYRLIDYFAVYGFDETQDIYYQSSTNLEDSALEELTFDFDVIQDIKLQVFDSPTDDQLSQYQRRHTIPLSNQKYLVFDVYFGRLGDKVAPEWDGSAISSFTPLICPSENSLIQVPKPYKPLFIHKGSPQPYSETDLVSYSSEDFDITPYIGEKPMKDKTIVFGVTQSTKPPLSDFKLIKGPNKLDNLPEGYTLIDLALGQSTFICYKTVPDPLKVTFKPEVVDRLPLQDYVDSPLSAAIPMFCFSDGLVLATEQFNPEVFSFVLTEHDRPTQHQPRIYVTCLVFYELLDPQIASKLYIQLTASHKVYAPKALCLVSHWPFMAQWKSILTEVYRQSLSSSNLPIERILSNLVDEVMLPDPGGPAVSYKLGRIQTRFVLPPVNYQWEAVSVCIEYLFRALSPANLLTVWAAALTEQKILLISNHKALLSYASIALNSLLFPFHWEQVFIPVLPSELKSFVETIFPYIIGVRPSMLTDVDIPYDAIEVDLDRNVVRFNENPLKLPGRLEKELLKRLNKNCIYKPRDLLRETIDEAFCSIAEDSGTTPFDVHKARDAFLKCTIQLLADYHKFLLIPSNSSRHNHQFRQFFDTKGFLKRHKASNPNCFLKKMTETSLFAHFIEDVMCLQMGDMVKFFDAALKVKSSKQPIVKPYAPTEEIPSIPPNSSGIDLDAVYLYSRFPRLSQDCLVSSRVTPKLRSRVSETRFDSAELMDLSPRAWAQHLFECQFFAWVAVFSVFLPIYKGKAREIMDFARNITKKVHQVVPPSDSEVFRCLLKACGHCGMREMAFSLLDQLKSQGLELDAFTHGVYVQAVGERQQLEAVMEGLGDSCIRGSWDLQECMFSVYDKCFECSSMLEFEDVLHGWTRSYSTYTTVCPYCNSNVSPQLRISMKKGDCEEVHLLGPHLLIKELENFIKGYGEMALLSKDWAETHKVLYWNVVFSSQLLDLPVFFLNPMREDVDEAVRNSYLSWDKNKPKAGNSHKVSNSEIMHQKTILKWNRSPTKKSVSFKRESTPLLKLYSAFLSKAREKNVLILPKTRRGCRRSLTSIKDVM